MFFRNLTMFRFGVGAIESAAALQVAADRFPLRELGPIELACHGFVPPILKSDALTQWSGAHLLFCVAKSEKILPAAVIDQALQKRVAEIAQREERAVGSRERRRLKDEVINDMLPRAFSRTRRTHAYVDLVSGWMVVNTATAKIAESVASLVREALGSFPCRPLLPDESPRVILTHWLANVAATADGFCVGDECNLVSGTEKWSGRNVDLGSDEVQEHLRAGMQVERIGLSFADRMTFTLDENLVVRKLKFSDVVHENVEEADNVIDAERAEFSLMSLEINTLLTALSNTFAIARP